MTFLPRHPGPRVAAALWLLASVVMLVVTLLRPDIGGNDRNALVYLTPLYWLSFPLGHAGLIAGIQIRLELYLSHAFVPSVLAEGLYLWTSLTLLGYAQWFLLVPWISRKCWQLSSRLFTRHRQPPAGRDPGQTTA